MNASNNKRITINMLMLYFRMFIIMGISLFTSRIILKNLGIEDFGIYSVVGGIVIMLSFLNSSMTSATQRFISYELGKKDDCQLSRVFSMSVNTHIIIALIIFLLAETIGLWFLNAKVVIPVDRLYAANAVYQLSLFSFMTTVIGVPYLALIISYEKMNIYAYVSIIESVLKLVIVFALLWFSFDKLILYALLYLLVTFIIWGIYKTYCKIRFSKIKYSFFWDRPLFNKLMNFAGWNLFGNLSLMAMSQGVNMLLNLFVGPLANAAWAISFQLGNAVSAFSNNVRTAVNPQIVKSHSRGNDDYMKTLVFESAKYSYFLLLLITLPILLETENVLNIWLEDIPAFTILFCQLILVNALIQCFDASFGMIFQAIGRIKENQLFSGMTYFLVLPISYFFLKFNYEPEIVFYIQIVSTLLVAFVVKIFLLKKIINISFSEYSKRLFFPVFKVTSIAIILPVILRFNLPDGMLRFVIVLFLSVLSVLISVFYLGIKKPIRVKVKTRLSIEYNKLIN